MFVHKNLSFESKTRYQSSQFIPLLFNTMKLQCEEINSDGVPERFICPLTLEIMNRPLMTIAGHSFERSAILGWLRHNDKHPLTREPLSPRDLILNHALQEDIRRWKAKQGNLSESETEEASLFDDSDDFDACLFISTLSIEDFESQLNAGTASASAEDESSPRRRRPRFSLGFRRRR